MFLPLPFFDVRGKLCGLSSHPMRDEIATVGDDGVLRIYDLTSHRVVRHMLLESPARCVAYSPDGTTLAVGLGDDAASTIAPSVIPST